MIFISTGHHKQAQGARYNDITEYFLAIKWTNFIVELLTDKATLVPRGRLQSKVDFINEGSGHNDIAIEIHFNSAKKWTDLNGNGEIDYGELLAIGRGSETLYYPHSKKGYKAAQTIQEALSRVYPPNRGAKEGYYQMNPAKGVDYFLKKTRCTALIIEPEFIDNMDTINDNMVLGCHAIADALLELTQ